MMMPDGEQAACLQHFLLIAAIFRNLHFLSYCDHLMARHNGKTAVGDADSRNGGRLRRTGGGSRHPPSRAAYHSSAHRF